MKSQSVVNRCVAGWCFGAAFFVVTICHVNSAKPDETGHSNGTADASSALPELPAFETMLSIALKNNPDVRRAESGLLTAQAELDRVRLQVAKQIKTFREQWQSERAVLVAAEANAQDAERLSTLPEGTISGTKVLESKRQLQASRRRAEMAQGGIREMKLMLPLLLGTTITEELGQKPAAGKNTVPSTKSDDVKKLLGERLQTLVEIAKLQEQAYKQGRSSLDAALSAQADVLYARLELAKTPAERITIREELLGAARQLQEVTDRMFQAREASQVDLLKAKALRLRAEADVIQERGGKP